MKPATEVTIRKQLVLDLRLAKWDWVPKRQKLLVTEMDMNTTRADLMVITPASHTGFEIKSGRDRLDKLERQIPAYELYCDYCWLVYDVKHEPPNLPPHWGFMRCYTLEDGSVEIEVEREATLNPTDPASRIKRICGHMWADEMKAALKSMGASGYSGNMKFKNMQWICNKSPTRVRPLVYRFLQARENWRPGSSNS